MDLELAGKNALITGASRGLGREIARILAGEGVRIALCARGKDALDLVVEEVRATGATCFGFTADLFDADDCVRVVKDAATNLGGLDILVNNASTDVSAYPSRLEEVTDDQLMERVMGKALASIRCSRAALQHLRHSEQGRVICIGGDASRTTANPFSLGVPSSGLAAGLGNAVLVNFAKRLSNETAKDGITVNVVHPGAALKGDRWDQRVARLAAAQGVSIAEAEAELVKGVPIGRGIVSTDIAPLVAFLASSRAGAITGQSFAVDGGANPQVIY